MQKRGQIALWVIVALVIIAAGIAAYLLFPDIFRVGFSKQKAQEIMFEQSENLRDTISYCVSEAVKYCLKEIGKRGGYYNVSDLWYVDFAGPKYVVVYKDEQGNYINKLPSLERMLGQSLNNCMQEEGWDKVDSCVNFESFKKFFNIQELSEKQIKVSASNCDVTVNISWPMRLSKTTLAGKVEQKIEQKDAIFPMCIDRVWRVANDITKYEIQGKDFAFYLPDYAGQNPDLKFISVDMSQNFPTSDYHTFMLSSIPQRAKEEPFYFQFVIAHTTLA